MMAETERYGGKIVVREYEAAWPAQFECESAAIREALGPAVLRIEHVGSTAVPGLAAKPILDLLVGVASLEKAREACIEPLEALGYTYLRAYEEWLPDEMLFRKEAGGRWTHHVHVTEPSGPRWDEFILIRNYFRRHPEVAAAYGDLKRALAVVFDDDIAGYREAKRPFLGAVMRKARAEGDTPSG